MLIKPITLIYYSHLNALESWNKITPLGLEFLNVKNENLLKEAPRLVGPHSANRMTISGQSLNASHRG